jgi:Uma2 family endonuclease
MEARIAEYWIFDRFRRTLTVIRNGPPGQPEELVVTETQTYQSPLLPGFEVPLAEMLRAADLEAKAAVEEAEE